MKYDNFVYISAKIKAKWKYINIHKYRTFNKIMAELKYLQRNADPDDTTPRSISLRFLYGASGRFTYSFKDKVPPKFFDADKERVRNTHLVPNREELNLTLEETRPCLYKSYSQLMREHGYVANDMLRDKMDLFLKRTEAPNKKISLLDHYQAIIDRSDKVKNPKTKGLLAATTVKSYKSVLKNFKRYHKEKHPVDWRHINMKFYKKFIEWMEEQDYSLNYIGTHIKRLKGVLTDATDLGINTNKAWKNKKFVVISEDVDDIYLSPEEIKQMSAVKGLSDAQERPRDLFHIGCYSGLRVSDFNNLYKNNLFEKKGRKFIQKENQKTGKEVIIPIHPVIQTILDNRKGKLPKSLSAQKINLYIKEVGLRAGITERVQKKRTIGGEKQIVFKNKYKLITTHTGRRSVCTNAYLRGMKIQWIMTISGHTTEKSFLRYIKITAQQQAELIADHEFFLD